MVNKRQKQKGFSLLELIIVVGILAVLAAMGLANYVNQLKKGRDAKRKKDLGELRVILEDYYNDNNAYPNPIPACNSNLPPWIKLMPCEPDQTNYFYETDTNGTYFKFYTILENKEDPAI